MMPDVEQLMHTRAFSGGEFWQAFLAELRRGAEEMEPGTGKPVMNCGKIVGMRRDRCAAVAET
jgi:hypothetical protein